MPRLAALTQLTAFPRAPAARQSRLGGSSTRFVLPNEVTVILLGPVPAVEAVRN